jgi:hypothetical protein
VAGWGLAEVVQLGPAVTAAEALERLRQSASPYGVIGEAGELLAVVGEADLEPFTGDSAAVLDRVRNECGVVVLEDPRDESADTVAWLSRTLMRTRARAVVVLGDDGKLAGAIPRTSVAAAVSPDLLAAPIRMYGRPDVPAATFVCRRCVPPTYRRPRTFNAAPGCPRDFRHGAMEPDTAD